MNENVFENKDVMNNEDKTIEHYLYTFSDNDIIDVIANPDEWTEEEVALATRILQQRKLTLNAENIRAVRTLKKAETTKEQTKKESIIRGGTSWFLWIAILSMLNITLVIWHQNVSFLVGLGINYAIIGVFNGIEKATGNNLMYLGFAATYLFSAFYIWIWSKSKKRNTKWYLTGMIIYVIDTLIFVLSKEWFSVAFHLWCLLMLYAGYNALLENKKANKTVQSAQS